MSKWDHLADKILQFVSSKGAGCFCSLMESWDNESDVSLEKLCEAVDANQTEVLAAVAYLVRIGMAEYRSLKSRTSPPVNISFRLRHEGLRYKEFRRLTRKEQWKERLIGFFSGIAVTVLGGLILSWILG